MANPALPRSAAGDRNPWLIAVVVSIATFMEVLDTTIANVALRHIGGSLAADQDEVDLDPHQLPGVERSRPAGQRLAGQRHRPQALLHDLRGAVHRQFAALRDVAPRST